MPTAVEAEPPAAAEGSEPERTRDSTEPSDYGPSIIGMTLVMRGELSLDEDLIIEGTFDGDVIDGVRKLSVGTFATVKARIHGESADIAGTVEGDFDGDGTVFVRRTAHLNGEIRAGNLCVEDGTNLEHAVLSGLIRRVDDD